MEDFDDLVTDPRVREASLRAWLGDPANERRRFRDRYVALTTSGTTALQALLVSDPDAFARFVATAAVRTPPPAFWRAASAPGPRRLPRLPIRAAIVVVSGPYAANAVLEQVTRWPRGLLRTEVVSLLRPMPEVIARLEALQPDHLTSLGSILGLLARERLAGRLDLELDPARSTVRAMGEVLTEETRELVRRAWGLEIADTYGAGECLIVARTCCAHGGLHVMSDLCTVEIADDEGRILPPGQIGSQVLVTNLWNRVQPIVRYALGDRVGIDPEPCPCGLPFPRLLPVSGRRFAVYWATTPAGTLAPIAGPALTSCLLFHGGVLEFQLEQTARDAFVFRYVPQPGAPVDDTRLGPWFQEEMTRAGFAGSLTLRTERLPAVPRAPGSGKLRWHLPLPPPPVQSTPP